MGRFDLGFASDVDRVRMEVQLEELTNYTISEGSMTIQDFCAWIHSADVSVKNSLITDISWWEEKTGLKHQFVLLRFQHTETGGDTRFYYIKLERAGKAIGRSDMIAIDKATISSRAEASDSGFFEQHELFFALVSGEDSGLLPPKTKRIPAFVDFLDQKWRGPPPTLQDLSRYLKVIVAREPNYSLTAANCFWFSRHVIHIIGLRHYSFPFVAFSIKTSKFVLPRNSENTNYGIDKISKHEWQAHDPSSIGLLFRFLHYEEWRNGILMFRRLVLIFAVFVSCALSAAGGYGFYYLFVASHSQTPSHSAGYATLLAFGILTLCNILAPPSIRNSVTLLTRWRIRRATETIVRILDRDNDADSVRGDFIPPTIPLYKERSGAGRTISGTVIPTYTMRVSTSPRELPTPWEREKQIYAPAREAYDAALDKMRDLNPTISERDLLQCTPETILERQWCRELVKMMFNTSNLTLTLYCMKLLHEICKLDAEAVVDARAFLWMKLWSGYQSNAYSGIRFLACRILAEMARHEGTITEMLHWDICDDLVAVIRTSDDVNLHDAAITALFYIVQTPIGAQAAIDAKISLYIDYLLKSKALRVKIFSCRLLECLVWLQPADDDTCKVVLGLLKHANSSLKRAALHVVFTIASVEDGAEMLVSAGALDVDWMGLLKSSDDDVRAEAPLVLVQLVRRDHTETWKRVMKYCAQLVSVMRDGNADVAFSVMVAVSRMTGHPQWVTAVKDAGAIDALSEIVTSSENWLRGYARRIRALLTEQDTGENVEGDTHEELLQSTPAKILRQNRCRELVLIISATVDLDLKLGYLGLLFGVCDTEDGAEAVALREPSLC
ncbi:armadillo-type protein [Mycena haematopus]|nr:armadillo-type protein [Mycena haematopus]